MKKLLVSFLSVILLLTVGFGVNAADGITFSMDSVTCQKNRIVKVDMFAQSSKRLCAALFEVHYNRSVLEFRGAESENGTVVCNESSDGILLSYLCKQGAELTNKAVIFTLEFKSAGEGSSPVDFTVKDCVDDEVRFIDVGGCVSGAVRVEGKSSARVEESSLPDRERSADTSVSKSEGKSSHASPDEEPEDLGVVRTASEREKNLILPIIILCASLLIAAVPVGYYAGKRKASKDKRKADKR